MSEPAREVREITSIAEWLEWRAGDWTASRLPALFDAHPYMSLADVVAIMQRGTSRGTGSVPDSPAMRRGRLIEPAIAAGAAEDHPEWQITKATTYHRLPDYRLGASPDFWIGDNGILETKSAAPHVWDRWGGHPPLGYSLQTLAQLMCTGRSWGVLAVMVMSPSLPVHYFNVARHPAAEQRILDAVSEFWRAFDAGKIPAAATSTGLAEMLDDGSHIDLSDNNYLRTALPAREELKAYLKATERQIDEIDAALKAAMGNAATGWLPGYHITYRTAIRKQFTVPEKTVRTLRVRAVSEDGGEESAA